MNNWKLNQSAFLNEFTQRFNLDGIKKLCFTLNIDYESLAGETKDIKALSLYQECEQAGRLSDLVHECENARPAGSWRVFLQPISEEPQSSNSSQVITEKKENDYNWPGLITVFILGLFIGSAYQGTTFRPSVLTPYLTYDFERQDGDSEETTLPDGLESLPGDDTLITTLTGDMHFGKGSRALEVMLAIPSYDYKNEQGAGGISIDLDGTAPIAALSAYAFIPANNDTESGGFQISFVAFNEEGSPIYSGSTPIKPGEWAPQFWGTRFAYAADNLCKDANTDGLCDAPADLWWYSWQNTKISRFEIRILRNGETYRGPVYLDDVTAYQLASAEQQSQ